jgi:hypothetical protein
VMVEMVACPMSLIESRGFPSEAGDAGSMIR